MNRPHRPADVATAIESLEGARYALHRAESSYKSLIEAKRIANRPPELDVIRHAIADATAILANLKAIGLPPLPAA